MKIIDCVQGSEEWFKARCGIPTSSNFDKIVMANGGRSKQRDKYLYQLAGETITGEPEETYKNDIMKRAQIREEEARQAYELITGSTVTQVGLCVSEGDSIYGSSPDGLVGKPGGLEIKCPLLSTHVSYLLEGKLPATYFQQTQGELFVTGRKWFDFMSYYEGIKPLIVRVLPDEKFAISLKIELEMFCADLKKVIEKIK